MVYAVFPSLNNFAFLNNLLSIAWLLATACIILFAIYFLKETRPSHKLIRLALYLVICFTGIIILLKLPFELITENGMLRKTIFEITVLLNAASMMTFMISFGKTARCHRALKQSAYMASWGYAAGIAMGLISLALYHNETKPESANSSDHLLQLIAFIVMFYTYASVIVFLFRLKKTGNYHLLFRK